MTAGLTPDQLSKFVSNPEVMVLMQDPKMQEIMKKVRDTESVPVTHSAKMSQQGGRPNRGCDNRGQRKRGNGLASPTVVRHLGCYSTQL